uniref:Uncharacterized protein n=1 Tax=Tetranychus urticae TaxID=32264 RepID=T1KD65_TETUR
MVEQTGKIGLTELTSQLLVLHFDHSTDLVLKQISTIKKSCKLG